jgi:DNA-directed RNA polymerase subunit RPC12/RpoP
MKKNRIQEEICEALEGRHKVRCSKCQSTKFIKTWCEEVEINVDTDEGSTEDDYLQVVGDEVYKCSKCGRKLKEEEIK